MILSARQPTDTHTADKDTEEQLLEGKCFLKGAFGLTGAVGTLWSAGWRLAVGTAAELCVVAGRPVLSCGKSGVCHSETWGWHIGAHYNSWILRTFINSTQLISKTQKRGIFKGFWGTKVKLWLWGQSLQFFLVFFLICSCTYNCWCVFSLLTGLASDWTNKGIQASRVIIWHFHWNWFYTWNSFCQAVNNKWAPLPVMSHTDHFKQPVGDVIKAYCWLADSNFQGFPREKKKIQSRLCYRHCISGYLGT